MKRLILMLLGLCTSASLLAAQTPDSTVTLKVPATAQLEFNFSRDSVLVYFTRVDTLPAQVVYVTDTLYWDGTTLSKDAPLKKVVLLPGLATLNSGATLKFETYARTVVEDTVSFAPVFTAGGGTIDSTGLYKAGTTAGTYNVIATEAKSGLADTAVVTIVVPPPTTGGALGKPYGPSALMHDTSNNGPFTYDGGASSNKPQWLLDNINEARNRGLGFIANLPCGSHSASNPGYCLKQGSDGVWRFDRALFDAALAQYNTTEVKAAVAQAVKDGVLHGINLMDEPWVSGGGDGNTWGPAGTMTRARVDSLCTEAKKLFPTAPVGTSNKLAWDKSHTWKVCDIGIAQFSYRFGSPTAWRDSVLAMSKAGGYSAAFSFNVINGGTQDRDGVWDCKDQGGHKGQRSPNCGMTATQIVTAVKALGDAGCAGLMMWRNDNTKFTTWTDWIQAFKDAAAIQAQRYKKPCKVR